MVAFFQKKKLTYNLRERSWNKILFLPRYFKDEIITQNTFLYGYFFKLFCIENDFAKYFTKRPNLFI